MMRHRLHDSKPHGGIRYNHVDPIDENGVSVEMHYRPGFASSPFRNNRLQRFFRDNGQFGIRDVEIDGYVFPIPSTSFNAVFQPGHIFTHFFDEGVGLRQLLDYYFVLRSLHMEQCGMSDRRQSMAQWAEGMGVAVMSNEEIMHTLGRFGQGKFVSAVMYVLQTVFAMPNEYLLCKPNVKEGRFLLDEIMLAGNFGKYDKRLSHTASPMGHAWEKLRRNMRFLTNYTEEALWEPVFRVYHWVWRKWELWRM